MRRNELSFHIARNDGLEFVFSSGHALRYPTHVHVSVFTITVVRKGAVFLCRNGSEEIYPAGSMYVLAPHEPHSPAHSDNFDAISLCVKKDTFHTVQYMDLMDSFTRHARALSEKKLLSPEDIGSLARGIEHACTTHGATASARAFDREFPPCREKDAKSRFSVIRTCKKEFGLTPYQYVIQNRIRDAKKMLAESFPIAEVAAQAGFYDQSHLNRWFNKTIGITPQTYKESCFILE